MLQEEAKEAAAGTRRAEAAMRKAEQAALSAASAQSSAEAEAAAARERAKAAEAAAQERELAAEAAARARAEAAEAARAEAEREAARLCRELKAAHVAQALEGAGGPSCCLPLWLIKYCSLICIEAMCSTCRMFESALPEVHRPPMQVADVGARICAQRTRRGSGRMLQPSALSS